MEIEITGTEKKLFSCMDFEGLIGNEELAMDETGFPSISIMAAGGGTYSGEGAFSGIHSIHFFKNFITCHLSLSTNKYHDCKLL